MLLREKKGRCQEVKAFDTLINLPPVIILYTLHTSILSTVEYSGPWAESINLNKSLRGSQMRLEDNLPLYTYENVASCTHHLRQWNWLLESRVRITRIYIPLSNSGLMIPPRPGLQGIQILHC